jgi:hypothetical protein
MSAIVGAGRNGDKSFLLAVEIYVTVLMPSARRTALDHPVFYGRQEGIFLVLKKSHHDPSQRQTRHTFSPEPPSFNRMAIPGDLQRP